MTRLFTYLHTIFCVAQTAQNTLIPHELKPLSRMNRPCLPELAKLGYLPGKETIIFSSYVQAV